MLLNAIWHKISSRFTVDSTVETYNRVVSYRPTIDSNSVVHKVYTISAIITCLLYISNSLFEGLFLKLE